jgi:hypothetical protein
MDTLTWTCQWTLMRTIHGHGVDLETFGGYEVRTVGYRSSLSTSTY